MQNWVESDWIKFRIETLKVAQDDEMDRSEVSSITSTLFHFIWFSFSIELQECILKESLQLIYKGTFTYTWYFKWDVQVKWN